MEIEGERELMARFTAHESVMRPVEGDSKVNSGKAIVFIINVRPFIRRVAPRLPVTI